MRSSNALCAALLLAFGAGATGCARQAVVASEPGRPGAAGDALESTLRADLQRLLDAQRRYLEREGRYADGLPALGFAPSSGVTVYILQGDRAGFSAIASGGDAECGVYTGSVRAPRTYVTTPDTVGCRP